MTTIKKIFWKYLKNVLIVGFVALIVWGLFIRPKSYVQDVKRAEVLQKVVSKNVSSTGVIKSKFEADLAFAASGKIAKIAVKKGDTIKKGALLGYVDTYSAYLSAQSLKDARDFLMRDREYFLLHKEQQIDDLGGEDEFKLKERQYNEKVDQAEASYRAALAGLSNGYLYAPFDATVVDVLKEEGETAVVAETIFKLADFNNFVFETEVDQEDFGLIRQEMPVEIELNSYPDHLFKATVKDLPLFADSITKTFTVEIDIQQDAAHPLKLAMEGDAHIVLASTNSEVTALTVDDIFYDAEDKPYVWGVENQKIKKVYITIGLEGDIYTQVSSELPQTVVIPVSDTVDLQEGYTARIIN